MTVTISNPSKFAIEAEVIPASKDSRWVIGPDHKHTTIKAGDQAVLTFDVKRAAGKFDTTARAIVIELGIDMLTDRHRYPIPVKRITVPGSLRVDTD